MNRRKKTWLAASAVTASVTFALMGCSMNPAQSGESLPAVSSSAEAAAPADADTSAETVTSAEASKTSAVTFADSTELFTERDQEQSPDLSEAVAITVADGQTITIDTEGIYLLSGTAKNASIIVDAADEAKVQLVLDGVSITNESSPCIYVKNADKVFVTTTDSENTLSVTGNFTQDGDTKTDAVIFSKDDLVLNGTGTLTISSSDNAVSSKDDLKITGGTYEVSCSGTAFEAHELIAVADGTLNITKCNDGLHAENDDDNSTGEVRILGGDIKIQAADDGIHATTYLIIDGGKLEIQAAEGLEGTVVKINDGTLNIEASDDGINAAAKSSALSVLAEFNGGTTTIVMGSGDTDAVDSNGDLTINGGTLDITAQSPFDYDGTATKNGGTIIVNGQETDEITNQFGGGFGGGPQGGQGGPQGRQGGPQGGNGGPQGNFSSPEGNDGQGGPQGGFGGPGNGQKPQGPHGGKGKAPGSFGNDNSQGTTGV